uniref:Leucine rich repeat protein n=1 Tax=Panagrolaimus sp. PS1159 TaxID=55785 RepID=A0AC35FC97_9BILA
MRLYCLTSISKVPPLPNSQNLTQSSVDENESFAELMKYANSGVRGLMEYVWWIDRQNKFNENEEQTKNDMYFNEFIAYRLTEICFGYEYYYRTEDGGDEERKHYVMKIYQNKIRDPFSALMIKGAISLTEVPNKKYAFDLRLATSNLSHDGKKIGYDFIVKIRNIKNTQTRGLLSEEEEEYYEKYSQEIAEIWKLKNLNDLSPESMAGAWDDAFDEISESQPFKLPNTSKIKFLQQKIRDMKSMIYLLCDPEIGNYKNMPLPKVVTDPTTMKITTIPCRFDQKIECLLYKKLKQFRIEKRSNAKQAKNYRDCPEIMWIEPNLYEIDLDGVNFGNLRDICIKKADLRFSKKFIHPIFEKINFKELTELTLIECNILELSGGFAVNDVEDFKINTEITEIKILNIGLKKINDLNIPLSNIRFLELSSNKLENLFFEKDTIAKLREIDLENNQMKSLHFGEMFTELTGIFVDQNELTSIDFILLLPNLEFLSAKNNKIKEIPEKFHKALCTLKLDFNGISELPKTFEESMSGGPVDTPHLSLSYNNFSYFDSNLEEVLWKRLPKKIEILNLNGNDLVYIPGTLCQKHIRHLFIDNCNIQHICPVIYTFAVMKKRKMTISICDNPRLEYLPFVPLTIFPKPPSFKERISFEFLYNFHFAIITDNEIFKNNAKFPMNNFKPVYNFDNGFEGEETRVGCKCCAICSKATDEHVFKNLMIMDFGLCFETDESCYEHSEKSKAFPCFKRGQWKTMVKSRMFPIPATEPNTFQNNYIENIVLLDQQGNYVTTIQNVDDFNLRSDSHVLNPENY